MNWDAVGAIGEIIGAVVVVITLLYLAIQIRQTSKSIEVAALRDTTAQWNQWSELLATTPDLAAIVVRGNQSYRQLSDEEALRYGAYVQSFFDNIESSRNLNILHEVDKDLEVIEAIVRRRITVNGFYEWWTENTQDYDSGFVDWVEKIHAADEFSEKYEK